MAKSVGDRDTLLWGAAGEPEGGGLLPLRRVAPVKNAFDSRRDYISVQVLSYPPARIRGGIGPALSTYPALHLRLSAGVPGHEDLDRRSFVAPRLLGQYATDRLNRVMRRDLLALGPVPFRSDLHLDLGLFSVRSEERMSGALGILNQLAESASQPFSRSALPFAKALGEALNLVLGFEDGLRAEVGLSQSIGDESGPGVFAVIYNGASNYSLDRVALRADDHVLIDRKSGKPVEQPHVVYEVSAMRGRDDWARSPDLQEAWLDVREAARSGAASPGLQDAVRRFQRVALASTDFVEVDARRIARQADDLAAELQASLDSLDGGGFFDPGPLEGALSDAAPAGADAPAPAPAAATNGEGAPLADELFLQASEYPKPFRDAMSFVFGPDGGFVAEDYDFNGPTALSIEQEAYNGWRDDIGQPRQHASKMSHAEAVAIFYESHWKGAGCGNYEDAGLSLAMFDTSLLFGGARAKRFLQMALTRYADQELNVRFLRRFIDGYIGPRTLELLKQATSGPNGAAALVRTLLSLRAGYHRARVVQEVKGRHQGELLPGWLARLERLHHKAIGQKPDTDLYSVAGPAVAAEEAPVAATTKAADKTVEPAAPTH